LSFKKTIDNKGADDKVDVKHSIIAEELRELERDELELFDDYLEMIMTYGYITLFAAAFPLGSTITCLFIYIEIRSDIFKLETCSKRPLAKKTHTIGTWIFA